MQRRLWRSVGQLERLRPSFFSMTYGALGSAQEVSIENAIAMHRDSPVAVAAHLTCSGATRVQIDDVVRQFYDAGIRRIVALRGDAASSETTSISGYGSVVELIESLVGSGSISVVDTATSLVIVPSKLESMSTSMV